MFEWDEEKNRANRQKHDVSFETAALVFDDPYSLTQRDPASEEERLITLGDWAGRNPVRGSLGL